MIFLYIWYACLFVGGVSIILMATGLMDKLTSYRTTNSKGPQ